MELEAVQLCRLFCDEWEQASAGGELANGVEAGLVSRKDVLQLGDVLTGTSGWTRADDEVTLFDSTGLAIQDLAICKAVYEHWREGAIERRCFCLHFFLATAARLCFFLHFFLGEVGVTGVGALSVRVRLSRS